MARLGWFLVAFGLVAAAVSAAPLVYVQATWDDPTINPVREGMLMAVGGFVGLLVAAIGGSVVYKTRHGRWPVGF